MGTDDRCQAAPGTVAPIADKSPAWASLVTRCTPVRPLAVSERKNVSHPDPSSAVVTSTPRILR
jgi:hypothetical protein